MYSADYQRDALQEVLKMVSEVKKLINTTRKSMAFRPGMGMEPFDLASQLTQRGVPVRFPGMDDDPTQR